jgi:putative ABC transport system ATP-binding protein
MSSIRCRQLCKTFKQGDEIITGLDHIDLDIDEGEFVCLSGPSGSGKTTLLNAIGGLDTPDSGASTNSNAVRWPTCACATLVSCSRPIT